MKVTPYERITTNYEDFVERYTVGDKVAAAILTLALEIAQQGGK
tara:strand:+ start:469 stop:600 length:132 start_codon:yes stop_codon:yes gene_type:complete